MVLQTLWDCGVMDNFHVYPVDDLIEHDRDSDDCVCGPEFVEVEGGWIISHHSLDGRERFE